MNLFFDVDKTIIAQDGSLRPWVRETFTQLHQDGHTLYVWSGMGIRWPVLSRNGLRGYVADFFEKPLDDHRARLARLGVTVPPDLCVDDHQEIVEVFGGVVVRPYVDPDPLDVEMHRVYTLISCYRNGH
ncbi:MAG: hypothetical protein HYY02_03330 [Chloroflexi bacterium]|nr:hypothetical protein [Chloroflexota bacterium]